MHKSIAYTLVLGATLALAACDKPNDDERRPVAPTTQETPGQTAPNNAQPVPSAPITPAPTQDPIQQPNEPAPAPAPSYDDN